jgi:pimeloyl-ACP methyl ester carboxylesterase
MTPLVFLPGFDGVSDLRGDFLTALQRQHPVRSVTYPLRRLGTLDAYRQHAMTFAPVDWHPVLVAESFSGLVAARWAALDVRVRGVVLCGAFARNPLGLATHWAASLPWVVQLGPTLVPASLSERDSPQRRRWTKGFRTTMRGLPADVIAERLRIIAAEDVTASLAGLRVPVLIVQFQGDEVIRRPAREHLEAVCHNAHVLRIPGPHFAIESRPQECADAIGRRIREIFPTEA